MAHKPWAVVYIICRSCGYYLMAIHYINNEWLCPKCNYSNVKIIPRD